MQTISRRTTHKGNELHIQIQDHGDRQPELHVHVLSADVKFGGFPYSIHEGMKGIQDSARPLIDAAARDGFVGAITGPRNALVFLAPDEMAAYAAAMDAWNATPARRLEILRDQRRDLCLRINVIHEQEAYDKDRAWDRGDEMRAVTDSASFKADLGAARQALRDFDAEHPEVWAAIEAEQAEKRARFLNYD